MKKLLSFLILSLILPGSIQSMGHNHSLNLSRKTVYNGLFLSLGLAGIYGLTKTLQSNFEKKNREEKKTHTALVVSASITFLLAGLLALNYPPLWYANEY